jgi:hypothetical protein
MKIIRSLILIVAFTGATYAGEMVQPYAPPTPPENATVNAVKQVLASFLQRLLTLR